MILLFTDCPPVAGMMLKKDMETVVRYLQERLVNDFGFKDDEVIESLQESIAGIRSQTCQIQAK